MRAAPGSARVEFLRIGRKIDMRISIFGLGYVGSVSAACLAQDGHTTIGVDVNPQKMALLAGGRAPVLESGLDELVEEAVRSRRRRV